MTIKANLLSQPWNIADFQDGSCMVFGQGRFDAWCIYHIQNDLAYAIRDVEVFEKLSTYSRGQELISLYKEFLYVFDKVTNVLNYDVVEEIKLVARSYSNPSKIQFLLTFLYAGMVAEENKQNAILKKFIKRLGVHQVLIEGLSPTLAANYSKGKRWQVLQQECEVRGFYAYSNQVSLSA